MQKSGIGIETARALSATVTTLFLAVRDLEKAKKNLAEVLEPGRVSLVPLNLDSFKSIQAEAKRILAASKGQINLLINSAGVMGISERKLTEDGIESHFSADYLGFFLLFQLLKQSLLASATPGVRSRVVVVSSSAHRAGHLPASYDYNFEKSEHSHETAYNSFKLAAVYLANRIERLYGSQDHHATSPSSGYYLGINTDISRNLPKEALDAIIINPYVLKILKSPAQDATTIVWAAVGKE